MTRRDPKMVAKAIRMWQAGATTAEIGRAIGRKMTAVQRLLEDWQPGCLMARKHDVLREIRRRSYAKMLADAAKQREADKRRAERNAGVCRRYAEGAQTVVIAAEFGIHQSDVSYIVRTSGQPLRRAHADVVARDARWLALYRELGSIKAVAEATGGRLATVRDGIHRAQRRELEGAGARNGGNG